MSLLSAIDKQQSLLNSIGRSGLNSLFPKDFELYIVSFELVDSLDNTLELFVFPIMPDNMTITEPEITNIKKTNRGVVSLKTDSFIPKDISLSGNFGRNLKILIRDKIVDFKAFAGGLGLFKSEFQGPNIKTGFGAINVMRDILDGSKLLDTKGNPCRLYFYNFAFGENYVVEVMDKTFSQNKDSSNLIWNYNITLKAVAPIDNTVRTASSLKSIVRASNLQKNINVLSSLINSTLSTATTKLTSTVLGIDR